MCGRRGWCRVASIVVAAIESESRQIGRRENVSTSIDRRLKPSTATARAAGIGDGEHNMVRGRYDTELLMACMDEQRVAYRLDAWPGIVTATLATGTIPHTC